MSQKPPPAWLLPALQEEMDWMGRQFKLTAPAALLTCSAWSTLCWTRPILSSVDLLERWATWHGFIELGDYKRSDSETALRAVYCHAVYYAANRVSSWTKVDIEKKAEVYRKDANRLREVSARMRKGKGSEGSRHASALDAAALYCDDQALEVYYSVYKLITKRHQGDPEIRGYCMMLVEEMRQVYGHEMRRSVAAIANCVLALKTLTDQRIRDWIKGAVN